MPLRCPCLDETYAVVVSQGVQEVDRVAIGEVAVLIELPYLQAFQAALGGQQQAQGLVHAVRPADARHGPVLLEGHVGDLVDHYAQALLCGHQLRLRFRLLLLDDLVVGADDVEVELGGYPHCVCVDQLFADVGPWGLAASESDSGGRRHFWR